LRHDDLGSPGAGVLADDVATRSGRAALCIPSYGNFTTPPRSVLIAWNGSREAARAVERGAAAAAPRHARDGAVGAPP